MCAAKAGIVMISCNIIIANSILTPTIDPQRSAAKQKRRSCSVMEKVISPVGFGSGTDLSRSKPLRSRLDRCGELLRRS